MHEEPCPFAELELLELLDLLRDGERPDRAALDPSSTNHDRIDDDAQGSAARGDERHERRRLDNGSSDHDVS